MISAISSFYLCSRSTIPSNYSFSFPDVNLICLIAYYLWAICSLSPYSICCWSINSCLTSAASATAFLWLSCRFCVNLVSSACCFLSYSSRMCSLLITASISDRASCFLKSKSFSSCTYSWYTLTIFSFSASLTYSRYIMASVSPRAAPRALSNSSIFYKYVSIATRSLSI